MAGPLTSPEQVRGYGSEKEHWARWQLYWCPHCVLLYTGDGRLPQQMVMYLVDTKAGRTTVTSSIFDVVGETGHYEHLQCRRGRYQPLQ